jgi:restriction system protein
MPHIREVKWEGQVDRDRLSVATRNSLGAISTLFKVPDEAATEIHALLAGKESFRADIDLPENTATESL